MCRRFRQLLQLTARGIASVGADSLHNFSFGQRPGGHLCQNRFVRLVLHNGDYKTLGPRTRSPLGKLAFTQISACLGALVGCPIASRPMAELAGEAHEVECSLFIDT
jgi:hypothetical protein